MESGREGIMMEWWQYKRMWEYDADMQIISGCKTGLLYLGASVVCVRIYME
jgi:hypothetical protein